jgi:signal transduction histidine kinase
MKNSHAHAPREYHAPQGTALALIVVAAPLLSLSMLVPNEPRSAATAAYLDAVALAPAALVAAACIYAAFIGGRPPLGWLATGATIVGLQGIAMAGLQLSDSAHNDQQGFWMAVSDASVLFVLLAVGISFVRRFAVGPHIVGVVVLGLCLAVLRLAGAAKVASLSAPQAGSQPGHWGWVVVSLCFVVPLVWLLSRTPGIVPWARHRLALATALFSVAHVTTQLDRPRTTPGSVVTLVADSVGAVLLALVAISLLRQAISKERSDRADLRGRLDEMEDDARRDRARIHEITSTVAGVVSATRLLREEPDLDLDRRRLLDDMVYDELGRLERLVRDPLAAARSHTVDLDATIGKLALSHQVRGHPVRWLPSGARITACPDDVAEVLNILLDNAAKHGAAEADVRVETGEDGVRILVSDSGPGIAPEMRARLFEWGARGPASEGQGIGLTIADELTRRHGGYLSLREDEGRRHGTTFVVEFPPATGDGHEQPRLA